MGNVIKIENLGKQYRLGVIGTGTLSHDLNRWWAKLRGKEDPFLKIGSTNQLDTVDDEFVWALKDINLEVEKGEVLGIIGKNGAGKSTLLKILSRVTGPTTGSAKVKGKIASLLEVGTGFHPELTGRENIFLNGAILGMTKTEIKEKLDEIIDFSGVEKYIDTPVKRYSSGMYVRMAFAVAAHLEPEILIIDEVLAVGDFEFQKKCLGKMKDVAGEGRTVLFVSHNMESVSNLCTKAVLIKQGVLHQQGETDKIIQCYLNEIQSFDKQYINKRKEVNKPIVIRKVELTDQNSESSNIFNFDEDFHVNITFEIIDPQIGLSVSFVLVNANEMAVMASAWHYNHHHIVDNFLQMGVYTATVIVPGKVLKSGNYYIRVFGYNYKLMIAYERLDLMWFTITEKGMYLNAGKGKALILPDLKWKLDQNNTL